MQNSYIYRLEKVKIFLETLPIDENVNALWDVLHQASWHKGIDWVRWIEENQELIKTLIKFDYFPQSSEEFQNEVWQSIFKFKNINI